MSNMSVKEALVKVLRDMKAMSAQQLQLELLKHRHGSLATALREAQEFLSASYSLSAYPLAYIESLLKEDLTSEAGHQSFERLMEYLAANDNSYALAA